MFGILTVKSLWNNQKDISLSLGTHFLLHSSPLLQSFCEDFISRFIIAAISFHFSCSFGIDPYFLPWTMHNPVPGDPLASLSYPCCCRGHSKPLVTSICIDSSLWFSYWFPFQHNTVLNPWCSDPQHVYWVWISVDPVTPQYLDKKKFKHHILCQHLYEWTILYSQETDLPFKINIPYFIGKIWK